MGQVSVAAAGGGWSNAGWLSVAALVVALIALLLAGVALSGSTRRPARSRRPQGTPPRLRRRTGSEPLTPEQATREIEALHTDALTALRHVAVVRYDAFADMGGHLSWSLALMDDTGDGVVLTSIHGRSDSRTYAKNVTGWSSGQQLSPEEEEALRLARSTD